MSSLSVPVTRFPLIASSPICSLSRPCGSSTPLAGTRSPPCVSARWSGMSGCVANPTPDTGYEPKFCVDVNHEHTPINLPDSIRILPHDFNATIAVTSVEPDVPRHSGTPSSSKHTAAASRFHTVLGSLGNCLWKQLADYVSVGSRNSIQETGAELDKETVVSTLFRSELKGKRSR